MTAVLVEHDMTVLCGDVRGQLATLPERSVQCVVTSPPYYGLRDYGTGTWEGGDPDCPHAFGTPHRDHSGEIRTGTRGIQGYAAAGARPERAQCSRCGAIRVDQQLGLEPSPAEYVAAMVDVFRRVRRVLRDDGTLWLNLGDSYSSTAGGAPTSGNILTNGGERYRRPRAQDFIAPKNLLGIPWRVAFALQDDGWTLRNAIIWHKPNAMPESVTDRVSARYEHVFLLSKSRRYHFDLNAIREPLIYPDAADGTRMFGGSNKAVSLTTGSSARRTGNRYGVVRPGPNREQGDDHDASRPRGRNPGDVWTIPPSPFRGAHFACMPPELARRCILAGCPERATVLDPFAGSGTTLMVARQLNRRSVGVELNPAYIDIIRDRVGQAPLDFGEAS